jgi:polysaccharide chain length determinant protein (PEP-CTERM system associated)
MSEEQQAIDIEGLIGAFKRRWFIVAIPIVLLLPVAALFAYSLPPSYRATGRILIESQQIPSDLAQSTVRVSVGERIAVIEQRLMTRQNLLDVAAQYGLDEGRSPNDVVGMMRWATNISGVRMSLAGGAVTGVNVSFRADSPQIAADVANEFVQLILEQNVQQRSTLAFETAAYFRSEVERLSNELRGLEEQISQFKIANESALPDSLNIRREELGQVRERLFERELQLSDLLERRTILETAIRTGEFSELSREATPEEAELARLRSALVNRRAIYSDGHPLIQSLTARIAVLEARVEENLEAMMRGEGERDSPADLAAARLERLDEQIEAVEVRIAADERRIVRLEDSIEATPGIELQLNALNREMDAVRTQHRNAVLKLAEAETGERLEVNQQAERFELIERAEPPSSPSSPNRPRIIAAGVAGSGAIGVGIAVLLELLNRSIRTPSDLERRLNLRPIAAIPYIRTQGQIARRRFLRLSILGGVLIGTTVAIYVIDQFVMPITLLVNRVLAMTGIDRMIELLNQILS